MSALRVFALMDVEDLTGFQIQNHGHIVMPFADGKLVNSEVSNLPKLSPSESS